MERPRRLRQGCKGSMDGMDYINSFVFEEYAFINQEIAPISRIKHDLFVANTNRIFSRVSARHARRG